MELPPVFRLSGLPALPAAVSHYHHGNAPSRALLSLRRGPGTHNSDIIGKGKMLQNIGVQSSNLDMQVQQWAVGTADEVIRTRTNRSESPGNIKLGCWVEETVKHLR